MESECEHVVRAEHVCTCTVPRQIFTMSDSSSDDESYEGDVEAERVEDFIGIQLTVLCDFKKFTLSLCTHTWN